MKVVVTGAAGRLAAALLPRLCAEPAITEIRAIDLRPQAAAHPKVVFHRADFRGEVGRAALAGADALAHLAFVVLRGRMPRDRMREINVAGTLALFAAARAAGVRRLVHLSSAAVYGSGGRLTEEAPLAPLPAFAYAQDKAAVERALATDFPHAARLRCHVIVGPNAQPLLRRMLAQPFYVKARGPEPQLQCVHEDDAAEAVARAVLGSAAGPFNVAAEDSFSFADAVRRRHRRAIPVPMGAAKAWITMGWVLGGAFGEPGWVQGAGLPLTLDCGRAVKELGWRPRHSSRAALAAMVPERS
ncbi:MAG: NAD-dependent epimerase/dehydratase family protein [Pseudomonadota bacterium]